MNVLILQINCQINIKMNTVEEFKSYVASVEAKPGYQKPLAFGLGVKRSKDDKTLDAYFPLINWEASYGTAAVFADVVNIHFEELSSCCFFA